MIYDDGDKKWKAVGRTPGLSGVCIYRHMIDNTFRVIGRKDHDHEVPELMQWFRSYLEAFKIFVNTWTV